MWVQNGDYNSSFFHDSIFEIILTLFLTFRILMVIFSLINIVLIKFLLIFLLVFGGILPIKTFLILTGPA